MESKRTALNAAGVIFLVVSIVHLLRFIFRWEVVINGFVVLPSYSIIAFVVAFLLSLWMFKSLK